MAMDIVHTTTASPVVALPQPGFWDRTLCVRRLEQ